MSNIHLENWHKYAPCLPTVQAGPRHFVVTSDYMQRNKFRCYRTFRAYGSVDSVNVNGTCFGLSYDIITKGHDGHLEVESDEGIGTRFIIEIPLTT